jgi:hypothetical protein
MLQPLLEEALQRDQATINMIEGSELHGIAVPIHAMQSYSWVGGLSS